MSDFNLPTLSSTYTDFLNQLKSRDVDSLTLCLSTPSNPPVGAIKYERSTNKFQEYNGSSFVDKLLSIAGGGTGASTAASARSNLGLGTLAIQNSSSVAITGGSITGVSLDASGITTGILGLARGGLGSSLSIGASGTFLRSNGSVVSFGTDGSALTNLNASALASGTVSALRLPANVGYFRNLVQTSNSAIKNLTTSYSDALTVTITPSSSSSRIRIEISANLILTTTSGNTSASGYIDALLLRGSTPIKEWRYALGAGIAVGSGQVIIIANGQVHFDTIDSPATATAVAYTIQFKISSDGSTQTARMNNSTSSTSTMTASEIGA